jgi:hypothetical protein
MIASFQAIRLRKTADKKTFSLYGKALRSLQGCLSDDSQPVILKLELVLMMMLCQVTIPVETFWLRPLLILLGLD